MVKPLKGSTYKADNRIDKGRKLKVHRTYSKDVLYLLGIKNWVRFLVKMTLVEAGEFLSKDYCKDTIILLTDLKNFFIVRSWY